MKMNRISELISSMDKPIKIAVPSKGYLHQPSINFLKDIRLLPYDFTLEDRKLTYELGSIELFLVRPYDIPFLVSKKYVDIGIAGYDHILERQTLEKVKILSYLDFGKTRLVIASNKNKLFQEATIVTEFPNITKQFLEKNNLKWEVIPVRGATEAYIHLGVADYITASVSTGKTLRKNNLSEIKEIIKSRAVLISKTNL